MWLTCAPKPETYASLLVLDMNSSGENHGYCPNVVRGTEMLEVRFE